MDSNRRLPADLPRSASSRRVPGWGKDLRIRGAPFAVLRWGVLCGGVAFAVLGMGMLQAVAQTPPETGGRRVVGYFTEWGVYAPNYQVGDVPAEWLTHLHYAFLRPVYVRSNDTARVELVDRYAAVEQRFPGDSDADPFHGNLGQLIQLKRAHPHLRTLLTVGGETLSAAFSDLAASASARAAFAKSCREILVRYGFDGVDLDWEFPVTGGAADVVHRPADATNQVLLVEAVRGELDAQAAQDGRDYLLTLSVSASADSLDVRHDFPRLSELADWIQVMAYPLAGPWSPVTAHQAPLYGNPRSAAGDGHAAEGVLHLVRRGVPRQKLVVGVPFFGQGFQGVGGPGNGLFQSHGGATKEGSWVPGRFDYRDLRDGVRGHGYLQGNGFEPHWDAAAHAPFLYNPSTGVFITYENPRALELKARFIREADLGGVMCWSLDADAADHELLRTLVTTLGAPLGGESWSRHPAIFTMDFDGHPAAWTYAYAYAGYGGTGYPERLVPETRLPNAGVIAAWPEMGGSSVLLAEGDFRGVPPPGTQAGDGEDVEWAYAGLGLGAGTLDRGTNSFAGDDLRDYTLEFRAAALSGLLPGAAGSRGSWKLELQVADDFLVPADADLDADTLVALAGDFEAAETELTSFTFRLDEARVVGGSAALWQQHRGEVRQMNVNFNFWNVLAEFGFDAGNRWAIDDVVLRTTTPLPSPPRLSVVRGPLTRGLILQWEGDGILEWAPRAGGEFAPVEGAAPPAHIVPEAGAAFFRVRLRDP